MAWRQNKLPNARERNLLLNWLFVLWPIKFLETGGVIRCQLHLPLGYHDPFLSGPSLHGSIGCSLQLSLRFAFFQKQSCTSNLERTHVTNPNEKGNHFTSLAGPAFHETYEDQLWVLSKGTSWGASSALSEPTPSFAGGGIEARGPGGARRSNEMQELSARTFGLAFREQGTGESVGSRKHHQIFGMKPDTRR